jgi:hypothetical protein
MHMQQGCAVSYLMVHHLADACLDEQLGALVAGEQGYVDALRTLETSNTSSSSSSSLLVSVLLPVLFKALTHAEAGTSWLP